MSRTRRAEMIDADHPRLSVARQCVLVSISRSFHYYTPKGESALNVQLMRLIDEQYLSTPWYGARQMARHLRRQGYAARRKRIGRLLRLMGLSAIYRKPKTSKPHPAHKIYPYLLRDLRIDRPNHVWCADITYIPMQRGFQYLVVIMDWATRTASPGACRTPWTAISVWRPWRRLWPSTVRQRSSIPTRAVNLPATTSLTYSKKLEYESPWTAKVGGWTTSSSNASGALSSTSASTYTLSTMVPRPASKLAHGSGTTTRNDLTQAMPVTGRRWRSTLCEGQPKTNPMEPTLTPLPSCPGKGATSVGRSLRGQNEGPKWPVSRIRIRVPTFTYRDKGGLGLGGRAPLGLVPS